MLKQAVMQACDALDGAADGVVSNVRGCRSTFKVRSLLCAAGASAPGCLTEPQVAALEVADRPFAFPYPMPNGVTSVGPFPALLGADTKIWFGDGTRAGVSGFYAPAPVFPWALDDAKVDADTWQKAVRATADVYDASSPDFDGFRRRDGKLILIQGTLDMLVPNAMTDHYFESIRKRYGSATNQFARYYVMPGYGHGDGDFRMEWDALAAVDRWVETGQAPQHPVARDRGKARAGRTRPLCEYPTWPKYVGTGSVDDAGSFRCVSE
jgi:feruloyl esterase